MPSLLPVGTKTIGKDGYINVKTESGWIKQHVLVMEEHLGFEIPRGMSVHHIDENKSNNNIDNLALMTNRAHSLIHGMNYKDLAAMKRLKNVERRHRPIRKKSRNNPANIKSAKISQDNYYGRCCLRTLSR